MVNNFSIERSSQESCDFSHRKFRIKVIDGDLFTTNARIIAHSVNCSGGGDWDIVLPMIEEVFSDKEVLLYRRDENVRM